MKKLLLFFGFIPFLGSVAQDAMPYQSPPKAIFDLVTAKPSPGVSIQSKGVWMLIMERSEMPSIEELAQPELKIAGLRINPNNFSPSRSGYMIGLKLKNLNTNTESVISGLPAPLKAGNIQWSPDEDKIAFTQTNNNRIDLFVVSLQTKKAVQINKTPLNDVIGNIFQWVDNNTILYQGTIAKPEMAPKKPLAPKGPTIQQNLGKVAASVTYQDLIKSPFDEQLFEFYGTSQLIKNTNSTEVKISQPQIFKTVEISPDKQYILIEKIDKPFSYLVTAGGFNGTAYICDKTGKTISILAKLPSRELAPTGYDNVLNAPRGIQWVNSLPNTVMWIEPQDSGLIKKNSDFRDAVFTLDAPFNLSNQNTLLKTTMRLGNITPLTENQFLVTENSRVKHTMRISKYDKTANAFSVLIDRSTDDAYNNPGSPYLAKNNFGKNTPKLLNGNTLLMRGEGASPNGDMPFLRSFNMDTKVSKEIWRCKEPYFETVTNILDFENMHFITSRQSQNETPNYFLHQMNSIKKLTDFPDPQPGLRGVTKEKITYKRKDGVDLAADLYLPKGYDKNKDGLLPVIMWAYPREFKSSADAAQIRGSKYNFVRVGSGSVVFWVMQGYAVMDNTEFPIVGEGDKQPNDNFIEQLVWNAEAAIEKIAAMGIGDRNRVAVGGHSYGAFMTTNLLAHCNLFKAGIARSGAYNRTLTPFGFQNEERTYWQAPNLYFEMSPFSYANKIKTPLLMLHGEADNNPGTFPIQSERLFNAIKGHGGIVRFVQLPFESHGYTAKESILHMLWEQHQWLEKYLKGK